MTAEIEPAPLVAILGPTASGKSALAVRIAEQFGGEVVACDSTQLYCGFDIGTAKPDVTDRRGIPHHLMDILSPSEEATAGRYRELAISVLEALRRAKKLPVFTVGTGLYLRALLEGFADVPQRSEVLRARLRAAAEDHAPGYLHRLLKRMDAKTAKKIALGDEQKLIRAVEVCILARKPISEVHRSGRAALKGWRALKIGLLPPRDALIERIHARTEAMLNRGWMNEVQSLLASGPEEKAKAFDFIGYRELRDVLQKKTELADARTAIQQATRQYAKRQLTWFRKELGVRWFSGFGDDACLQSELFVWLREQGIEQV